MAKREKKEKKLQENGEESESKVITVIFAILTILIWLVVFGALIKLDVGGFGSRVLRPVLKDVPVINKILPEATDVEIAEENNYNYKNLAEAVEYIKELELMLAEYQQDGSSAAEQIADLQSEVERLKEFEQNQTAFEQEKQRYYEEVVLGDNSDEVLANYQQWYENMDPATAEVIYGQVLQQIETNKKVKDYVNTFNNIEAESAARIFQEMTGDLDTIALILNNMDVKKRSAILSALAESDAVFAAKITQLLAP